MPERINIIPLGGVGEIGRNMTVIEYAGKLIAIDCGMMFPERDMLGIDIVIPDFTFLRERRDDFLALFVTHGHEDHIGAISYLLRDLQGAPGATNGSDSPESPAMPAYRVPIYATPLTRGLIEVKLKEHRLLRDADLHTIAQDSRVTLGPFAVEAFPVSHSIPDAVGYAITTSAGLVIHTGEYKFDYTPRHGRPTDVQKLAEFGARGVLALLSDSTNADRPGHTPSEEVVTGTFDRIFATAPGRVIVATFASNISRVQQIIDAAYHYEREVGVVGRSMQDNSAMARELGYLKPADVVVFHPAELLHVAKQQARAMAESGHRPPLAPTRIPVAGSTGIATLKMMLVNMKEGGFISAHDYEIGSRIATVMCGGEVEPGSVVDEQWLLDLERHHFVELAKTAKTQERIEHMLKTGKPLRN